MRRAFGFAYLVTMACACGGKIAASSEQDATGSDGSGDDDSTVTTSPPATPDAAPPTVDAGPTQPPGTTPADGPQICGETGAEVAIASVEAQEDFLIDDDWAWMPCEAIAPWCRAEDPLLLFRHRRDGLDVSCGHLCGTEQAGVCESDRPRASLQFRVRQNDDGKFVLRSDGQGPNFRFDITSATLPSGRGVLLVGEQQTIGLREAPHNVN